MSVTSIDKDLEARTLTVTAEWEASVERVWNLWSDPRQLERWWGPPTYPATVTEHDLQPDGYVRYYMTSPEGERYHGLWRVVKVDAPHLLVVDDLFADDEGNAKEDMPTSAMEVRIEEAGDGRTRMVMVSRYATTEALEQVLEMGMLEGIQGALSQVDAILAEG